MTPTAAPIVKELVLIGGGHSHVEVIKSFGMRPMAGVRVTLISKDINTPYSGMLPGYIAGHYTFEETHVDLRPLANFAGAQFYHSRITGIDLDNRLVHCANRPPVRFDVLSINTGSAPDLDAVSGAREHALPVKPIERFIAGWEELTNGAQTKGDDDQPLRVVTVGGGAGGVELTLATQFALKQKGIEAEFALATESETILPTHNRKVQRTYERILRERNVKIHTGCKITEVRSGELAAQSSVSIAYDVLFWVTNAAPPRWAKTSELRVDAAGFIAINDRLQSESHPFVFAAGDVASCEAHPRPKSGVFAVRQGPPLARNLRLACADRPLEPFRPQKKFLSLISTGDQYAVASRGALALRGDWVWKWKDWIDRRWMRKYQEFPEMKPGSPPSRSAINDDEPSAIKTLSEAPMPCGGCGSKVGSTVLSRVLKRLHPIKRADVLVGLDAPDDAAITETPAGKVAAHTVDFFRSFLNDPYTFGKIASNHALSDIFAMGAEPQSALAMAVVPYGVESAVEEQLFQVMTGAVEVLNECGCALAGGHTSEGAELSFGLSVQGLGFREQLLRKGGMQPGDRLILTKPLGTGTLFAADMRRKAKGVWIESAIESMLVSNQAAAEIVHRHGATACTDVTGFGLLGHLVEMLKASNASAEIDFDQISLLPGAAETIRAGILSSLHPDNLRLRRAIANVDEAMERELFPILFDPQTSGGLLAGLPVDSADDCLSELRAEGLLHSQVIGSVNKGGDSPTSVTISQGGRN